MADSDRCSSSREIDPSINFKFHTEDLLVEYGYPPAGVTYKDDVLMRSYVARPEYPSDGMEIDLKRRMKNRYGILMAVLNSTPYVGEPIDCFLERMYRHFDDLDDIGMTIDYKLQWAILMDSLFRDYPNFVIMYRDMWNVMTRADVRLRLRDLEKSVIIRQNEEEKRKRLEDAKRRRQRRMKFRHLWEGEASSEQTSEEQ